MALPLLQPPSRRRSASMRLGALLLLWLQRLWVLRHLWLHAPRRQRLVPRCVTLRMRRAPWPLMRVTLLSCSPLFVQRVAPNVPERRSVVGPPSRQHSWLNALPLRPSLLLLSSLPVPAKAQDLGEPLPQCPHLLLETYLRPSTLPQKLQGSFLPLRGQVQLARPDIGWVAACFQPCGQ